MTQPLGKPLALSKAFYALYYGAGACLLPFLALYYSDLGFDGREIGVLRGLAPLVTLISAPLWGAAADGTGRHKALWLLAIAGTWAAVLGISLTTAYWGLLLLVVAYAFFGASIMPLADSAVMTLLGKQRGKYGLQRIWGAVGWGVASFFTGFLTDTYGLTWAFIGFLALMAGAGLTAAVMPAGFSHERRRFGQDFSTLMTDASWVVFLGVVFVAGLYLAFETSYLLLYLDSLGVRKSLMGIALVVATVSELPVWALGPRLLRRWGSHGVLGIAIVAGLAQAAAYVWLVPGTPWLALPTQLLHGLAFSAMWLAGVTHAAESAPAGTQATAQGLFGGVHMGMSAALGAFIGGWLFEKGGGALMFRWAMATSLMALALLWWAGSRVERQEL
ncbi:MAG: MFS transporter [Anaerolineae bacterium]